MITRIEAGKRYQAKHGWLSSYHLFSFAEYFDRTNLQFGTLRVFNDDTIDAFSGFDTHGHEDMEIVTLMWKGTLTHRDSMGNQATIQEGEVQCMSAGTGVMHSEKNLHDEPVHLYQLWFLPSQMNLKPRYAQTDFTGLIDKNALTLLASNTPRDQALLIQTEASIYASEMEEGKEISFPVAKSRGVFVYVRTGAIEVNGAVLATGDQARITHEDTLIIKSTQTAAFVLIEVGMDV